MDFDSLKNKVQNLTLYDIKAGVRQVQNGEIFGTQRRTVLTRDSGDEPH
jgi:epsin